MASREVEAAGERSSEVTLRRRACRSAGCAARRSAPTDVHARASHALGKSYADVVRGFRGRFQHPPDFVARPRDEADVERLLEWCSAERVAAIPYGGGTASWAASRPMVPASYNGAISIDLRRAATACSRSTRSRARRSSRAAPPARALEAQLAEHGLTLRHFPQSFELSTLGGWIATRAAGHFATVWTHIEDFVESVRAITPRACGRRGGCPAPAPASSPDRMLVGSEGTLGVITEAWVRVQPRPAHRRSAACAFATSPPAPSACARSPSRACTRPTAA